MLFFQLTLPRFWLLKLSYYLDLIYFLSVNLLVLNLDNKNISITKNGEELIEKTTNRINEKIIKVFKKTDPKNMAGFINIIESI